jgi:hypothetical protein
MQAVTLMLCMRTPQVQNMLGKSPGTQGAMWALQSTNGLMQASPGHDRVTQVSSTSCRDLSMT